MPDPKTKLVSSSNINSCITGRASLKNNLSPIRISHLRTNSHLSKEGSSLIELLVGKHPSVVVKVPKVTHVSEKKIKKAIDATEVQHQYTEVTPV